MLGVHQKPERPGRLAQNGTPIADAVPSLPNGSKGEYILAWLTEYSCTRYVILDDHDCSALGSQVHLYPFWQIRDCASNR